jgi:hypothetical protein
MPSIFLCHSAKDKFFVRELASRLEAAGLRVWLDEAELNVGDSLTEKIGAALEQVDYVGVVLSSHSINSEWVQRELRLALDRELKERKVVVLPILREKVDVPAFFRDKVYADFTSADAFESTFPKLLHTMGVSEDRAAKISASAPEAPPPVVSPTESERRLASFQDISITDLDTDRSYKPDPDKLLYNMYLRLSGTPPADWADIFDAERSFPRHTMWRRAWVEGNYIVVHCVPDELEEYHLSDLRQDVANANRKYRAYLLEEAQREVREKTAEDDERRRLRELRKDLGFN